MKWNNQEEKIFTNSNSYYYYIEEGRYQLDIITLDDYKDEAYIGSPCSVDDENWEEKIEGFIEEYEANNKDFIEKTTKGYTSIRQNVSIRKAGGNASKNSKRSTITIPSAWVQQMGIDEENKSVKLTFDGKKIVIMKEEEKMYALKYEEQYATPHWTVWQVPDEESEFSTYAEAQAEADRRNGEEFDR